MTNSARRIPQPARLAAGTPQAFDSPIRSVSEQQVMLLAKLHKSWHHLLGVPCPALLILVRGLGATTDGLQMR